MSSWANKRKWIYVSIFIVVIFGLIGVPAFFIFYHAPTCTDGILNGDESGVDCGGSCVRLCQSAFLSPSIAWTRFERLAPKLYNVATYIINPNTEAEAKNVPYRMSVYDARGILIIEIKGTVTLPPHRNTVAFKGAVNVGEIVPAKVSFEFTAAPQWVKTADTLSAIAVIDKKYTEDDVGSSLIVTLKNNSVRTIYKTAVAAVLYDKDNNALGFSKTYIDGIYPEATTQASFTWPINRKGSVISLEVLPVAE